MGCCTGSKRTLIKREMKEKHVVTQAPLERFFSHACLSYRRAQRKARVFECEYVCVREREKECGSRFFLYLHKLISVLRSTCKRTQTLREEESTLDEVACDERKSAGSDKDLPHT